MGDGRQIRRPIAEGVVEVEAAVRGPGVEGHDIHTLGIRTVEDDVHDLAIAGHVAS